jgi:hypothetical protein
MTSLQDATLLLQLCPVCIDIQNKILYMLLGYGTFITKQLKTYIKWMNNWHRRELRIQTYIYFPSLWRYISNCNGSKILYELNHNRYNNLECLFELQLAFLIKMDLNWLGPEKILRRLDDVVKSRLNKILKEEIRIKLD